jgi:hypothetical protein
MFFSAVPLQNLPRQIPASTKSKQKTKTNRSNFENIYPQEIPFFMAPSRTRIQFLEICIGYF